MLETILIIIICLICSIALFVLLKRQNQTIKRTPIALAKQMLRHPERILIDIPLYATPLHGSMNYEFLLETEIALASIGELQTRRQFLVHVADVVRLPSKDSIEALTNFLFHVAPQTFTDTLRWDGKCDNAIHFLEFMEYLTEALAKGRKLRDLQRVSKKKRKHSSKNLSKELQGMDAEIMQEWFDLHAAVHKETISWQAQSHRTSKKWNRTQTMNLVDESKVNHLLPFLVAAREVYKSINVAASRAMEAKE